MIKILAAAGDDAVARELESALAGAESDLHAELTLLICTPALEQPLALTPIMDAAVEAWQRNALVALCVDSAEPPLGFRDAPRLTWIREADSPNRLREALRSLSADALERPSSTIMRERPAAQLYGILSPGPIEPEDAPPRAAARRNVGLAAGMVIALALVALLSLLLVQPNRTGFPAATSGDGEHLDTPNQVKRHVRRAVRFPLPAPDSPPAKVLARDAYKGDPQATYDLALLFAHGQGIERNEKTAVSLIELAAENNLPIAKYQLGFIYERGIGGKQDLDQARQWYERAATDGNRQAMHNLAVLLAEDPAKSSEAARWFRSAADTGLTDSQYNVGLLYEQGTGVKRDLTEAAKWYAVASINGDAEAGERFRAVAAKLDADQTSRAIEAAADFKPKPIDLAANEAPAPGGPGEWNELVDRLHIARELGRNIPARDSGRRAWLDSAITEAISSVDKAAALRGLDAAIADAEKAYPELASPRREARIAPSGASAPTSTNVARDAAPPAPEPSAVDLDRTDADAGPKAAPRPPTETFGWPLLIALGIAALALALLAYGARTRRPAALWNALFPRSTPSLGIRQPVQEPAPDPSLPAVFASYSHADAPSVDRVVAELENDGIGVWVDRQRIGGGAPWPAQIVRAIRDSQVLAVFCSQHAFSSDHVFREIHLAIQYKKVLVPIMLEPVQMPDLFLYYLSPFQSVPVSQSASGVRGALHAAVVTRGTAP